MKFVNLKEIIKIYTVELSENMNIKKYKSTKIF